MINGDFQSTESSFGTNGTRVSKIGHESVEPFRIMWVKKCHKPPVWEWLIPPIYDDLGMIYYCFTHITPLSTLMNYWFRTKWVISTSNELASRRV
jgi:hypothetical protein